MKEIYKNVECSLDITGSDCCERYFPGIGFNNRKKKTYMFLRAVRKFFCVVLIGMVQRTSYL